MNRRDLVKGSAMFVCLPSADVLTALDRLEHKNSVVTVLKHSPNTRYETLREFNTTQESIEFVKALRPRIVSITIAVGQMEDKSILRSGYRGAVRGFYKDGGIVNTVYEIIDTRNEEIIISVPFDDAFLFDCGRAWSIIENIRVDGKPVQMHETGKLPLILTQPLVMGTNSVHYVDLNGHDVECSQGVSNSKGSKKRS